MAFGPTAPGTLLTDKIMLTPASYLFLAVILLLILLRFSFPSEKTGIFRNIFIALTAGITLLLCGILLFCAGRFSAPEFPAAAEFSGFRLSFGEAAELSSAAALSWIPVFFLFSLHNQSSVSGRRRRGRHTLYRRMFPSDRQLSLRPPCEDPGTGRSPRPARGKAVWNSVHPVVRSDIGLSLSLFRREKFCYNLLQQDK